MDVINPYHAVDSKNANPGFIFVKTRHNAHLKTQQTPKVESYNPYFDDGFAESESAHNLTPNYQTYRKSQVKSSS